MDNYLINAHLERRQPLLTIIDKRSGHTVLRLQGSQVSALIERGDIWPADLCRNSTAIMRELLRELLPPPAHCQ